MSDERKYVRVYYSVVNDDRFAEIYHDGRRFGTWLQLLLIADAMYPADAPIPAYVHRASLKALTDCGLVEIRAHQHFRVHGLASERGLRSESGRIAAGARWHSGRNADPMPRRDKTRQDEHIARPRARDGGERENGGRPRPRPSIESDPLLAEIKAAQLEQYGPDNTPIVPEPTRALTAAEREREATRLEALALHERFRRGEITEPIYERLRADIGKEPDDLTRLEA